MGAAVDGQLELYFEATNRSKKSIELDLSDPTDLAARPGARRRADVLVENYREGSLARKGLGYEQVAAENPRIVYCLHHRVRQSGREKTSPGTTSSSRRLAA